jgi:hypothetical protein
MDKKATNTEKQTVEVSKEKEVKTLPVPVVEEEKKAGEIANGAAEVDTA